MTYSIRIKITDGQVTETDTGGTVPDGTFAISGHDDGNRANLNVQQHDAGGRFVTSASHTLDRAETALRAAEATAGGVTSAGGTAGIDVAVTGEIPAGL
jgi:hypothetical protein